MGRAPCCDTGSVKKGAWSAEEDRKLKEYIHSYGTGGNWIALPAKAGMKRCGKSCRLRWLNYLRPNIKHGDFSDEEDRVICTLFATIGSRWSIIATQLPGRTDNHVKNYWNTKLKKKLHHLLIAATHGHHYRSKPPAPPCFSLEHHHHTSPTSAASSGQLLVFGAGGAHQQYSPCAVDNGAGLRFGISNNSSGAVELESLMLSGLQLQQEDTNNLLFPAAAATAENDIMTSGGALLLDHHQQRQYQQYGGGGSVLLLDHHQQRQYQQYGSGGSYEDHTMKPPLMISPDGFFYGDGEAVAAGAAATQQGTRFLY